MTKNSYRPTIGIECHVQLKTASKLFSGASNDAVGAAPNTLINHIDYGLPGALPVLNHAALELATRASLALGVSPQLFSTFDRKHYFYPDLPMGYQITQYANPIILGGVVRTQAEGHQLEVAITRAHLESDAGKSTHPEGSNYSLVDLNRAGTPLLEIVSDPDMHSPAEARAYAQELYLLMRYAGVTNGDLYQGNMRFDVNVSLSLNDELGTRTETKNLNSFRSVEKAVAYEIKRQSELLDRGERIRQETRGWNDAKQRTFSQRSKENADDYRYMPDPDIPPVVLTEAEVEATKKQMPRLPDDWRKLLRQINTESAICDTLLDANINLPDAGYLALIERFINESKDAKQLIGWLVNTDIPWRREKVNPKPIDRYRLYDELSRLRTANQLSSSNAKLLLTDLLSEGLPTDVPSYAKEKGLLQLNDNSVVTAAVEQVIKDNPKAVSDLRSGQDKVLGFLTGQVMKATKGQANPEEVKKILTEKLDLR